MGVTTKWQNYYLTPAPKILLLSEKLIRKIVTNFWKDIMKPFPKDKFIGIMLKVEFASHIYRTIGVLEITNNKLKNRKNLVNNLLFKLELSKNNYQALEVKNIYMAYRLYEKDEISKINPALLNIQPKLDRARITIENKERFPNSMDL
jgi:hypothetical protein